MVLKMEKSVGGRNQEFSTKWGRKPKETEGEDAQRGRQEKGMHSVGTSGTAFQLQAHAMQVMWLAVFSQLLKHIWHLFFF